MLRSLVVNADDLGLTIGVNNGIFDAHDRGVLTSASVFANAAATGDALIRAMRRPSMGIGCHLTLVDGRPILPAARVPSLIEGDGRFPQSWRPFIVSCLRGRVSLAEVERELTAQIDRVRSAGVTLTHLDAHKHVHAYPPIFAIVTRLAERFRIPVVRVPFERWSNASIDGPHRRTVRRQAMLNAVMLPWAWRDYRSAARAGIRTPHFIGRAHTGVLSGLALTAMLRDLPPGVTELMVHPGYVDEPLERLNTRLLDARADEVDLLTDPKTFDLLSTQRITLIRHDLSISEHRSFRHAS
ncbi:MAG TPA: ChbG/HpnK family deacetylase [Vicinamibacterales bacterium]|nr:ChbG/HpnK family deacetylase [Vicinamibacterales bacterium]